MESILAHKYTLILSELISCGLRDGDWGSVSWVGKGKSYEGEEKSNTHSPNTADTPLRE